MAGENNEVVEDIERVDISGGGEGAPAEGDEPEGDGPEGEGEGAAPEGEAAKPDQIVHIAPAPAAVTPAVAAPAVPPAGAPGAPQKLAGETDREFAMRLEITRLRGVIRGDRASEITGEVVPPGASRKEMSPEQKAVIEKYEKDPKDKAAIDALREVFPALAAELGFVRSDEIAQGEFQRESSAQLDMFLEKHPEYLPENDPGNVMWDRLRSVYGIFKPATNAKDMAKLLERAHREVFGIQAPEALPKDAAAARKVEVASHAGAPASPAPAARPSTARAPSTGARFDMLKGFSPEEIEEMRTGGE